jgi:DNA-binding MarR family transcriptional regulator
LAPLGLRPRHLVTLTVLREHGDETQQALASAVGIDPTNLVGLLNDLETAGHLTRDRDPADRRRHIVRITPGGRTALDAAEHALGAAEDQILGALDGREREQLFELLQRATGGHVVDCATAASEECVEADARSDEEHEVCETVAIELQSAQADPTPA